MKTTIIIRTVVLSGICLLATKLPSNAQNVFTPSNPSFEVPASAGDTGTFTYSNTPTLEVSIPDWTAGVSSVGTYGTINYAADPNVTPIAGDGLQGAYIGSSTYNYTTSTLTSGNATNNDGTTRGSTGIFTTIVPNATYTLSVDLAYYGSPGYDPTNANYANPQADNSYYDNDNQVTLRLIEPNNGNAIFATTTIPFADLSSTMSTQQLIVSTGASPVGLGQGLQVQISTFSSAYVDLAAIDNVTLTAEVPEPSTWALMLAGVAGLFIVGRRKLKA